MYIHVLLIVPRQFEQKFALSLLVICSQLLPISTTDGRNIGDDWEARQHNRRKQSYKGQVSIGEFAQGHIRVESRHIP